MPVYLVGAKMTDYYPLSIVGHGVALNITVQSHVDQICFGLIACRRAVPDVHELGKHVQRAMETLRVLVSQAAAAAPPAEPAPPALAAAANGRASARATRVGQGQAEGGAPPTRRRVVAVGPHLRRSRASRARHRRCALKERAMRLLAELFVVLVALLHVYFLVLEMFLWDKPLGLRVFRHSVAEATASKVLAANQGLYNGFLAAGLAWGVCWAPSACRSSCSFSVA